MSAHPNKAKSGYLGSVDKSSLVARENLSTDACPVGLLYMGGLGRLVGKLYSGRTYNLALGERKRVGLAAWLDSDMERPTPEGCFC